MDARRAALFVLVQSLWYSAIFTLVHDGVTADTTQPMVLPPYPKSKNPPAMVYVLDDSNMPPSQMLLLETIQGFFAKTDRPMVYLASKSATDPYNFWMQDLKQHHGIVFNTTYQRSGGLLDFLTYLTTHTDVVKGYILYSKKDNSTDVAISLSAIMNGWVAVSEAEASWMTSLNIRQSLDVRGKDSSWLWQRYGSKFHGKPIIGFQRKSKSGWLADYSVFASALTMFTDGPYNNDTLTDTIFSSLSPNSALLGWGSDELTLVSYSSAHSVFVNAADLAKDLSLFTNVRVSEPIKQHTHSPPPVTKQGYHTVCFLFTDGDNIQWMLNAFATTVNWFASPYRGMTHIGWTVSPALLELAPSVLDYLYRNAADNHHNASDFFVAAPSGVGYMYPDSYAPSQLNHYAALTSQYMNRTDLRIVNVIGNNPDAKYLQPYLAQDNIDAVFFYYYINYAGMQGAIQWINKKPVIGARHRLWQGFNTPQSLASKLNAASTNIHSQDGYSLIAVHAWSMTVKDVVDCVRLLGSSRVRVVAPDAFVSLIRHNIQPL